MKIIFFLIILTLHIPFIKTSGDAYQATWYGGSEDKNVNSELNPSCYDHQSKPDTDYYAAISTKYNRNLCDSYAVVMAVDNREEQYLGKMVKVKIIDSCHECKDSHIDLSREAFKSVRRINDGVFPVIWVAAFSNGKISREIIYPPSQTESFAKSLGLSKSQFVSMYKEQALRMIKNNETRGTFNKNAIPKTTTTTRRTTTTRTTTTRRITTTVRTTTTQNRSTAKTIPTKSIPNTNAVAFNAISSKTVAIPNASAASIATTMGTKVLASMAKTLPNSQATSTNISVVPAIGDINIITDETNEKTIPEEAPIVGQTKTINPQQTNYSDEELKALESQFPDEEGGSYTIGILSTAVTVSGAAGIGLLYLKKQSPSKYDELKQKFPDAFSNLKRSVSRSASGLKRSATGLKRSLTKRNDNQGDYRAMPDHMFGTEGLPTLIERDNKYQEAKITI
ncbi:hypothetical protein BCR36DRAFT_414018 [Piromyces finnis]|uniref:RlpA-like protein double-psi beta-barrel domain-containing protein n=1 Tax=Piromyces finnis TaxID=1754191 RepID=A0A1Y1V3A4_9FUNG|nr:hypothetical protein BCR36DRAFT_414018 [Piromyces finnis]|eukprot:ORX46356.1 hypothetical protein BCR36DRAFT_414018 [Piromyces finnis]